MDDYGIEELFDFYNVFYGSLCLGIFVSGTFSTLFKLKSTWILTALQFTSLIISIIISLTKWEPGNWFIFIFMFWSGLLDGCAYVKTFSRIHEEEHQTRKMFSLGITTIITSLGIVIGAVASMLI